MKQPGPLVLALTFLVAGCSSTTRPPTARTPVASSDAAASAAATADASSSEDPAAARVAPLEGPPFPLARASNLARLGALTERQQELLRTRGFFLAPQPPRPPRGATADEARTAQRATHLFQVYERNDYLTFPSYVTVDLAIDATHAYFDALLRDLESRHLIGQLRAALPGLILQAERLRAGARTPSARATAARVETFWAVTLQLLERRAPGDAPEREVIQRAGPQEDEGSPPERTAPPPVTPVPPAVRAEVARLVGLVFAARGERDVGVTRAPVDLGQMRPRGHYGRTGGLQRFFRAMSWLGMVAFTLEGEHADVEGATLLARTALGAGESWQGIGRTVALTTYFAGGPDAAGLDDLCARITRAVPGAATADADTLLAPSSLARIRAALGDLPSPRISSGTGRGARQIRVAGRRAFEDAVALQPLATAAEEGEPPGREAVPRMFGALGAAAVLGSDTARDLVAGAVPARRDAYAQALERGRAALASVPEARWGGDGYHGTLDALRALLGPRPPTAPALLRTEAWTQRALLTFAGGWAELRHDTILYGEQLGAECDAPEPEPPSSWVEPVPEVYSRLIAMVRALDRRLREAGIQVGEAPQGDGYVAPLERKTEALLELLTLLEDCSERELRGEALTPEQLQRLTTVGGSVEWLLITLANTDLLSERDRDMAVVADVFTWRPGDEAVEVGVAYPDLMYALVPSPQGPVIARGAVMSYREFLQPAGDRMTDETWRQRLSSGQEPPRPAWSQAVYAEPVRAIGLSGEGVSRCGPQSGATIEL